MDIGSKRLKIRSRLTWTDWDAYSSTPSLHLDPQLLLKRPCGGTFGPHPSSSSLHPERRSSMQDVPGSRKSCWSRQEDSPRLQSSGSKRQRGQKLQPLTNPVESLSDCFKILSSDDWMNEIDSLKIIRALVQHHSEILKIKLHEVCLVLIGQYK